MQKEVKMSIKEADRLSVMQQIDKKILTLEEASQELSISLRQTKRLRKRYMQEGAHGLISRKIGKKSNRRISEKTRKKVIQLTKLKYYDFGPTLIMEKLDEIHGIKISRETLRKWLIEENIWTSKRKKEIKIYQRRARRSQFGELLQGDGSPEHWFEKRGPKCTLLQFVDDATSIITAARFEATETTEGYLRLLEQHLTTYGRPLAIYVDKHSVFRVNKEEIKKGLGITHFGSIVKALGIELICAHSPQAKGRVERKNGVLQDRLIKEMRLSGVSSIEEGNQFLPGFLKKINLKFGKEAANSKDAHRALRKQDDLKKIFCRETTRKLSKDLTFQHHGTLYLIETKTPNRLRHATVHIRYTDEAGVVEVLYKENLLKYRKRKETTYEQPEVVSGKEIGEMQFTKGRNKKPSKHHPWR